MKDENLKKMSDSAFPILTDVPSINILICDLFNRLKRPMTEKNLEDILVGNDIVSYFFFRDSLDYLIKSGSLDVIEGSGEGKKLSLSPKGKETALKLKNFVSKSYRDISELKALIYFSNERLKDQVVIDYEKLSSGYCVHIVFKDSPENLMDLKFRIPTLRQAKFLCRKVRQNPNEFYKNIFSAFDTNNPEEDIELSE